MQHPDPFSSNELWVLHLIHAYELSEASDFDADETAYTAGKAVSGTNVAYVFSETIRDRAAFAGSAGFPKTVDENTLKLRTVLHEAGHLMGLVHGTTPWDGIMNLNSQFETWPAADAKFTLKDFGIIQSISKPTGI